MPEARPRAEDADATRRKVFIVMGLITALLVALLIYLAVRPHRPNNTAVQQQLAGALRAGTPEFEQARARVVVEFIPDEDAFEATRPVGDIVMTMRPKVRNFTGRTLTGVELKATVVDLDNQPLQTRTFAYPATPEHPFTLEPNRVFEPTLVMEGLKKTDVRANIRIELTGLKFQ